MNLKTITTNTDTHQVVPKDGTRISGYDGDYYFCCHYSKDFGRFISGFAPDPFDASKMFVLEVSPTHWMPLPQAPEVG